MTFIPKNPNGQTTMANSSPAVLASDQTLADEVDYAPQLGAATGAKRRLQVDPSGALITRGQMTSDEGGYRTNFAGSSLANSIGTCTWTNGSVTVTGTGFDAGLIHLGDYVYRTSDGSSKAVQVDSFTATTITLASAYTGTSGSAAGSMQILVDKVGTGASMTVSNGVVSILSGTTDNAVTELERDVDFLPLKKLTRIGISQRIPNQSILVGFYDENGGGAARYYFRFEYNGTNPTQVDCVCAWNPTVAPTGGEIMRKTVSLPPGLTSFTRNDHRVELLSERVAFIINDTVIYTEKGNVPWPEAFMTSSVQVVNGVGVASTTLVTLEYDACSNVDVMLAEDFSQTAPIVNTTATVNDGAILVEILNTLRQIANPLSMEVSSGRTRVVLDALGGAQTLGTVTTVGTVTSQSQMAGIPLNGFVYDTMHNAYANAVRAQVL